MNHDTEVTKDTMLPTNNGSTEDVQPSVVHVQSQNLTSDPDVAPVSAPMPNQRTSDSFPHRRKCDEMLERLSQAINMVLTDTVDTIPNGDALTKVHSHRSLYSNNGTLHQLVSATEDSPEVPAQTSVETVLNMTPENKAIMKS
ncbi:hypothetical protein Tco_0728808 [Tanacetum coccineum]|uniref:Uncharacterized protein n=1 Tax=Tanacetum coccineum TaxID=301880 RepID=A0ABQ4YPV3_9ASTR